MFSRLFGKNPRRLEPISPADGAAAKKRLQLHARFDIDTFLETQTPEVLFGSPLGPTPACLSVEDVSQVVDAAVVSVSAQLHLGQCIPCRRQIDLYARLQQEPWSAADSLSDLGWAPTGLPEIDIFSPSFIRVPAKGNLYLVVLNRGNKLMLADLDPASVEVKGAIDGVSCRVQALDPEQYGAHEAVKIDFKNYTLNVPNETGLVCNYLDLEAKSALGSFHTRRLVRVIDESKVKAISGIYDVTQL